MASDGAEPPKAKRGRLMVSPRQSVSDDESTMSQKVYSSKGYAILLRTYVSRKSAKKGRALLEKLGLTPERIDMCFSSHSLDEEEAVQAGLLAWKDNVSSDPTWKVLVEAMEYAGIGVQHVEELKEELFQNEKVFAPIERHASVEASSLVPSVPVNKDDVALASVLIEFLKQFVSRQTTPPGPAPPVPNPTTPDSSGQSSAVLQSDSTTAPAVGRADGLHVYRMSSNPRGLAVIINNEHFTGNLRTRDGSHIDAENLYKLFSWLGYKVMVFVDLTAEKILSTVQQLASLDYRNLDSFMLCILTHGEFDKLCGVDEVGVPIEKVFEPFNGENSPTLAGKPKIFLIAANRGKENDQGVEVTLPHPRNDGDSELSGKDHRHAFGALKAATEALSQKEDLKCEGLGHEGGVQVLPVEADFVIVYATPPGYVSWRNSVFGTWFIRAFVDVMFEHAAKYHFLEILTFLNNRIGMKFQSRSRCKQIAETTFRLTKLLYFNPPQPSSLPPMAQSGMDESGDPADPLMAIAVQPR